MIQNPADLANSKGGPSAPDEVENEMVILLPSEEEKIAAFVEDERNASSELTNDNAQKPVIKSGNQESEKLLLEKYQKKRKSNKLWGWILLGSTLYLYPIFFITIPLGLLFFAFAFSNTKKIRVIEERMQLESDNEGAGFDYYQDSEERIETESDKRRFSFLGILWRTIAVLIAFYIVLLLIVWGFFMYSR